METKSTVEWRPVTGYEDFYSVSSRGDVFSFYSNRLLTPKPNVYGYIFVALSKNGTAKKRAVHRLVAEAFISNPEGKPTVNHINEIKTDNRVENLEWATVAEQNAHGTRTKRAISHTDWVKRTKKMDYAAIAAKHNYHAINRKQMKPILQFDMDGNFIARYDGLSEAARKVGVGVGHLCSCLKGRRKTCGGYHWKYA